MHAHALSVGSLGSHQTGRTAGEDAAGAAHAASLRRAAAGAAGPADEEDAASADWRAHRKHVFVLTNAGRPVWTLHGREDALVGFMAIVDAMLAFAQTRGDAMRSIRCAAAAISRSEHRRVPQPCSVWGCSVWGCSVWGCYVWGCAHWSDALHAGACVHVRSRGPLCHCGSPARAGLHLATCAPCRRGPRASRVCRSMPERPCCSPGPVCAASAGRCRALRPQRAPPVMAATASK